MQRYDGHVFSSDGAKVQHQLQHNNTHSAFADEFRMHTAGDFQKVTQHDNALKVNQHP